MKNIVSSKKITTLVTALLVSVTMVVYVVFETKCFGDSCGSETIRGLIKPFIWFGITASFISAFFLFFSQALFLNWLKRIASWYLPVLLILAATTPVFSSNVLSVSRSQLVFTGMVLLGITAIVYAFVMRTKL